MSPPLALIEGIGGLELMMIMFIVLLLFGANKLPELARGFGKSMREFKKAASGVEEEFRQAMNESERKELAEKRPAGALPRPADSAGAPGTPARPAAPPPAPEEPMD
ncbi:MAG TPA: twin-arginine translocase TatA/TatE family subunit [Opitutaceae bacterium]|nr:twin-arginine translocase TatA/TatE family subunit [Opitutaceae bacterium]